MNDWIYVRKFRCLLASLDLLGRCGLSLVCPAGAPSIRKKVRTPRLLQICPLFLIGVAMVTHADDGYDVERLHRTIDAQAAPVIIDVRSLDEFNNGHIPGAHHIPFMQIPNRMDELAAFKQKPVVVYCEVGARALAAKVALKAAGFERVSLLEGHMSEWRKRGYTQIK